MTPRQIVESHLYAEVLEEPTKDFHAWYAGLSDDERDAAADRGQQAVRSLAEELTDEVAPSSPPPDGALLTMKMTRISPKGTGSMGKDKPNDSSTTPPPLPADGILFNAYLGAWVLGLTLGGLSVFGLFRWRHWTWAAPITCAVLALGANQRLRHAETRAETALLGTLALSLLVAAGLLAVTAARVAR